MLNFYSGYSKNYSGPHGYNGATNTSFYDLHSVKNLNMIHQAFVILEIEYYDDDIDVYNYYSFINATFPIARQEIPSTWILIYNDEEYHRFIIFYAQ